MAVVKANYVRKGRSERVTAKANIRYIQERPGRDKEKLTRPLFNNAGVLGDSKPTSLLMKRGEREVFLSSEIESRPCEGGHQTRSEHAEVDTTDDAKP